MRGGFLQSGDDPVGASMRMLTERLLDGGLHLVYLVMACKGRGRVYNVYNELSCLPAPTPVRA